MLTMSPVRAFKGIAAVPAAAKKEWMRRTIRANIIQEFVLFVYSYETEPKKMRLLLNLNFVLFPFQFEWLF